MSSGRARTLPSARTKHTECGKRVLRLERDAYGVRSASILMADRWPRRWVNSGYHLLLRGATVERQLRRWVFVVGAGRKRGFEAHGRVGMSLPMATITRGLSKGTTEREAKQHLESGRASRGGREAMEWKNPR